MAENARSEFAKKVAHVTPAILTLKAAPAFAKQGSAKEIKKPKEPKNPETPHWAKNNGEPGLMRGATMSIRAPGFSRSAASAAAGIALLLSTFGIPVQCAHAGPETSGQWSRVYAWPDVAVHLHLLPDGKVMTFAPGNDAHDNGTGVIEPGFINTFVVDIPANGVPGAVITVPNNTTNIFCGGHTFLPDGELLVAGGQEGGSHFGSRDVNILSYKHGYRWEQQTKATMNAGRWYPTVLTLADGDALVVGGERKGVGDINPLPQVWQTKHRDWRDLTTALLAVPTYSPLHVAPDGRVFMSGSGQLTRYLDTAGTGSWNSVGNRLYGKRDYGSSVMYEPGKVLVMGGGDPPTATAEVIDLNGTSPSWKWTGSMAFARRHLNATILPDGKVLVTGGTASAGFNVATNAVFTPEIWDPAGGGKWSTMANMQRPRLYHSSALLLPDGRVLSAGGGAPPAAGLQNENNSEIFSPPYLFKGVRPIISRAPKDIKYGKAFSIKTLSAISIAKVTLVRLSSVTHAFNMNQRFNSLQFSKGLIELKATAPSDRGQAPPGHYMLFILNGAGVPSVAQIVRLRS
jgi:Domain of unknown function (DUF1929)